MVVAEARKVVAVVPQQMWIANGDALFAFVIHSLLMGIGISGGIRFYQNQQKKKVRASK